MAWCVFFCLFVCLLACFPRNKTFLGIVVENVPKYQARTICDGSGGGSAQVYRTAWWGLGYGSLAVLTAWKPNLPMGGIAQGSQMDICKKETTY